jgi:hypothetical protein
MPSSPHRQDWPQLEPIHGCHLLSPVLPLDGAQTGEAIVPQQYFPSTAPKPSDPWPRIAGSEFWISRRRRGGHFSLQTWDGGFERSLCNGKLTLFWVFFFFLIKGWGVLFLALNFCREIYTFNWIISSPNGPERIWIQEMGPCKGEINAGQ